MRGLLRLGTSGLLAVVVMAGALWGTVALWFALSAAAGVRPMLDRYLRLSGK